MQRKSVSRRQYGTRLQPRTHNSPKEGKATAIAPQFGLLRRFLINVGARLTV
jgi:hypothetical protein